jgi:predicted ArsR family transcriptional regulator
VTRSIDDAATVLQQQARALGDETRHGIFRYLAEAARPVDVAELTAHVGRNHNAIRQHLAKLVAAGLVLEAPVRSGSRGRPRLVYELAPGAGDRWGGIGPYERLSLLLAEIIRTGDAPVEVGRRASAGYRAAATAATATGGPVGGVRAVMARLGFEPEVRDDGDRTDVVLATCPFASTALADPATVCAIHLGLAEGLVEGTDVVVDELVARDPRQAQCLLRLRPARPPAEPVPAPA